jgi:transcriptional regulator with XRE-family HTH domain
MPATLTARRTYGDRIAVEVADLPHREPISRPPRLAPPPRPPVDPNSLGGSIRHRRRQLGLTLGEAARAAEMSKPYLSLIENGRLENPPSDGVMRRIAAVLDVPAADLLARVNLQRTPPAVRAMLAVLLGHRCPPAFADDVAALRRAIRQAGGDVESAAG